jgi:hypothetical protein
MFVFVPFFCFLSKLVCKYDTLKYAEGKVFALYLHYLTFMNFDVIYEMEILDENNNVDI